jgi:hypothetical protein
MSNTGLTAPQVSGSPALGKPSTKNGRPHLPAAGVKSPVRFKWTAGSLPAAEDWELHLYDRTLQVRKGIVELDEEPTDEIDTFLFTNGFERIK